MAVKLTEFPTPTVETVTMSADGACPPACAVKASVFVERLRAGPSVRTSVTGIESEYPLLV